MKNEPPPPPHHPGFGFAKLVGTQCREGAMDLTDLVGGSSGLRGSGQRGLWFTRIWSEGALGGGKDCRDSTLGVRGSPVEGRRDRLIKSTPRGGQLAGDSWKASLRKGCFAWEWVVDTAHDLCSPDGHGVNNWLLIGNKCSQRVTNWLLTGNRHHR
ncbi:hypothetical protein TIFTF001_016409 [Ficus carica]|uniref:Uncharacterized protein n=1 Tax=Ficus carica TaxID=3494 RepID=A0AA88A7P8_FICCA|nr:hypothetical protein TIFTF001_016409 [Ficus carica]